MHNKTKTNTEPPQPIGSTPNNRSTTTEPPPWNDSSLSHREGEGLNASYWYQIFALDYIVVKAQNCRARIQYIISRRISSRFVTVM